MVLIGPVIIAVLMVIAVPRTIRRQMRDVTAGRGFAGPGTLARGGDTMNALTSDGGWQARMRSGRLGLRSPRAAHRARLRAWPRP